MGMFVLIGVIVGMFSILPTKYILYMLFHIYTVYIKIKVFLFYGIYYFKVDIVLFIAFF